MVVMLRNLNSEVFYLAMKTHMSRAVWNITIKNNDFSVVCVLGGFHTNLLGCGVCRLKFFFSVLTRILEGLLKKVKKK